MPRSLRIDVGGEIYHCLNRAVARQQIFNSPDDYHLFLSILEEVYDVAAVDILAFAIMPNHWHLVLRPRQDGGLADFMKRLTVTHTQRYRVATKTVGQGPVYQGRYKSFLIQEDEHLLTVLRYVERNPVAAHLVKSPADWQFGSYYIRNKGAVKDKRWLAEWPIPEPIDYNTTLEIPLSAREYEKIMLSRDKGVPFGSASYVLDKVEEHHLQSTLRGRGRPKLK
jgi:putative transposase